MNSTAPRVALIGANGHGRWHRRVIGALHRTGQVRLVGLCDLAPITDLPEAPVPPGAGVFDDYRDLLTVTGPDVVVICTPPHTHLELAVAAARAGADLLLEKPPLPSLTAHARLVSVLASTGRVCQVGFQALGSAAFGRLTGAVTAGRLGRVTGIGVAGAWQRPDSYYRRAPWAGRRWLAGAPVVDGVLVNPFAHAVMLALAVAEAATGEPFAITELELELYRARPIEVDDTAGMRFRAGPDLPVVVAATLCGDERLAGTLTVHTEQGRAELEYTTDWLRLPGERRAREVPGRTGLLENLFAHRAAPEAVRLLVPLERTRPFTWLVEQVMAAPEPVAVDPAFQVVSGEGGDRVVTVVGATGLVRRAAERLALLRELGDGPATGWLPCRTATNMQTGTELAQD
ncbi:MAG: gfo/Idh/MocA family oxidoreductase [Micromonosporaceae bacterium]|nr:gfo/Idh/MocA family oxidoreductase [Micromonosporaceae bacterium]